MPFSSTKYSGILKNAQVKTTLNWSANKMLLNLSAERMLLNWSAKDLSQPISLKNHHNQYHSKESINRSGENVFIYYYSNDGTLN